MAQVLAEVPRHGLDAVLVAVELALESAPPGAVSTEHVLNVLAALQAQPRPSTVQTSLQAEPGAHWPTRRAMTGCALRQLAGRRPTMREHRAGTRRAAPARHGRGLGRTG